MLNPARIPLDVRGITRIGLGLLAGVNERLRALRTAADEGKPILFADLLGGVLIIRGEVLPVGRGNDLVDRDIVLNERLGTELIEREVLIERWGTDLIEREAPIERLESELVERVGLLTDRRGAELMEREVLTERLEAELLERVGLLTDRREAELTELRRAVRVWAWIRWAGIVIIDAKIIIDKYLRFMTYLLKHLGFNMTYSI